MKIHAENTKTDERVMINAGAHVANPGFAIGDEFTVAGVHTAVPNTERSWWQFWKPRWRVGPLQRYKVTHIV